MLVYKYWTKVLHLPPNVSWRLRESQRMFNTCINGWRHGIEYTQVQKLSNLLQKCTYVQISINSTKPLQVLSYSLVYLHLTWNQFHSTPWKIGEKHARCMYGGGDSSVVREPDSWSKGRGFESLQERRENFLLQGQLSVLTLISVSVPSPCYCSST